MASGYKFLSVAQAVESATGRRVNPSTCWRWAARGSKGVRLETWLLGGRRVTTVEAVLLFLELRTAKSQRPERLSNSRAALEKELGIYNKNTQSISKFV